jgi:hypothetical protein
MRPTSTRLSALSYHNTGVGSSDSGTVCARLRSLSGAGVDLPSHRDECPELYDFIYGGVPLSRKNFGPICKWTLHKHPVHAGGPQKLAELVARIQEIQVTFVPTLKLQPAQGRRWLDAEAKAVCACLRAASERGIQFDVECQLMCMPSDLLLELILALNRPDCRIESLSLVTERSLRDLPMMLGELGVAIGRCPSLQALCCPVNAELLAGISQEYPSFTELHLQNYTRDDLFGDQARCDLLEILKFGNVTQASIDGLFEFPDCHAFAQAVADANASGKGRISTVSLTADNPCFGQWAEQSDQCILSRERIVVSLLEPGMVKHLVLPSEGWAAGLSVEMLEMSELWSLRFAQEKDKLMRLGTLGREDYHGRAAEVQSYFRMIERAKTLGTSYGLGFHFFKMSHDAFAHFLRDEFSETRDGRALACVNQETAKWSRRYIETDVHQRAEARKQKLESLGKRRLREDASSASNKEPRNT